MSDEYYISERQHGSQERSWITTFLDFYERISNILEPCLGGLCILELPGGL